MNYDDLYTEYQQYPTQIEFRFVRQGFFQGERIHNEERPMWCHSRQDALLVVNSWNVKAQSQWHDNMDILWSYALRH